METRPVPPSAFGFVSCRSFYYYWPIKVNNTCKLISSYIFTLQRSILPKSRSERLAVKDKVALERNRINQRVGWEARLHQQNAPETSALLTSCSRYFISFFFI